MFAKCNRLLWNWKWSNWFAAGTLHCSFTAIEMIKGGLKLHIRRQTQVRRQIYQCWWYNTIHLLNTDSFLNKFVVFLYKLWYVLWTWKNLYNRIFKRTRGCGTGIFKLFFLNVKSISFNRICSLVWQSKTFFIGTRRVVSCGEFSAASCT